MAERSRYFWTGIAVTLSILAACTVAAVASSSGGKSSVAPLVAVESAQAGIPIGLDFGNTLFGSDAAHLASGLDDAVDLGADWIRVDMPWDGIQTAPTNSYDWSPFDTLVGAATARGLKLLVTLVDPPAWVRSAACAAQENCEPADPHAYAAFAKLAAERYAPLGVHDWEIWNEENLGGFSSAADPERDYATLLSDAYGAIHSVDARAVVMIGGLGMVGNEPSRNWIGAYDFLSGVAAAGGLDTADAVAVHPYDWHALPENSPVFKMIDGSGHSLESVLAKYGHADTPFWITETGAPTAGPSHVSYPRQAELATATVAAETRDPHIAGLFWYTDTDLPDEQLYYGLRDANGTAKPAYTALEAAIAKYRASVG